jgi:hypothetical protein
MLMAVHILTFGQVIEDILQSDFVTEGETAACLKICWGIKH